MALHVEIDHATSANTKITYWKIDSYLVQPGLLVNVSLSGYWTKADRQANRAAIDSRRVAVFSPPAEVTREWLYEQIKANPEFAGADDA